MYSQVTAYSCPLGGLKRKSSKLKSSFQKYILTFFSIYHRKNNWYLGVSKSADYENITHRERTQY